MQFLTMTKNMINFYSHDLSHPLLTPHHFNGRLPHIARDVSASMHVCAIAYKTRVLRATPEYTEVKLFKTVVNK